MLVGGGGYRNILVDRFQKYPPGLGNDFGDYKSNDMFALKEYFYHLFEAPADDVTWLRIKQPGTYTILLYILISSVLYFLLFLFHLSSTQETR